jgi:hypothetical protein
MLTYLLESSNVDDLVRELRRREKEKKLGEFAAKSSRMNLNASISEVTAESFGLDINPNHALRGIDSKTLFEAAIISQKAIYEMDDRQDLYQINECAVMADFDSVMSLFDSNQVIDNKNGTSTLATIPFGKAYGLCPDERFYNQPVGGFGTGFLVKDDVIATAGHCVQSRNVSKICFIFGFRMADESTACTKIDNNEIYRGINVIDKMKENKGSDWALVKLDRKVSNHRVANIRREGAISKGQQVHVIGHPCGLPMKFAAGAKVLDNSHKSIFFANLDTYGGNSGSPVFNSDTHLVEGILVRGGTDFVQVGDCRVSFVYPITGARGEEITRTTEFSARI